MISAGFERKSELREHFRRYAAPTAYQLSIGGGQKYELFQNRGSGARGCFLLPQEVMEAGDMVCQQIAQVCDLVILSKFGKLEAEHG